MLTHPERNLSGVLHLNFSIHSHLLIPSTWSAPEYQNRVKVGTILMCPSAYEKRASKIFKIHPHVTDIPNKIIR